jgi:putative PIN family toxin of toxin-antitoxin system
VRIVFDTASFITALRSSDGSAGEVLRLILGRKLVPLMDHKLGLEYRDVALRPEQLQAFGLSTVEVFTVIEAIEALAESVKVVVRHGPLSPDPNDDMILDIAINGKAEALVTKNTKDFKSAGKQYGLPVLTPRELLMQRGLQDGD